MLSMSIRVIDGKIFPPPMNLFRLDSSYVEEEEEVK